MSRKELRDLDVKIRFLEGIVGRDRQYVEALQILGDHYTQRGNYNHSLKVDEQLSRLEPRNPLAFYNLACSYSLNGEFDDAAAALEQALSLGYAISSGSLATRISAVCASILYFAPSRIRSGG
jgi:tetratricopeptide (TPR) repeat protein